MTESEFKEIVELYSPKLISYANSFCCDIHAAQDIVQEAFISFLKYQSKIDNPKPWLYAVCRNKACDRFKKSKAIPVYDIENIDIQNGTAETFIDELNDKDLEEILMRSLDKISESDAGILNMKYFGQMSYIEISLVLGISVSNVGVKISRAVARLKKQMEQDEAYEK